MDKHPFLAIAILMTVLALLPLWVSAYYTAFLISVFLYIALAGSWNLFSGMTGYISLGHGLFFGVGGYAFASAVALLKLGTAVSFVIAGTAGGLGALLLSFVLLTTRIRVAYFAIVMLGLNEIVKTVVANTKVIGSSYGLTLPPMTNYLLAYYFLLVLALAVISVTYLIQRSRWGYGLKAVLADEVAAEVTGVRTVYLKTAMFVTSGVLVALAGAMTAWYWSYLDPYMAFNLSVSFEMVVMTVFGGIGTVAGPVLGAIVMSVVKEALSTSIPEFHTIIFGVVVIALILWCPGGIIELTRVLRRRLKRQQSPREAAL